MEKVIFKKAILNGPKTQLNQPFSPPPKDVDV